VRKFEPVERSPHRNVLAMTVEDPYPGDAKIGLPEILGNVMHSFLMVTDTTFCRYRHDHTPTDTPGKPACPAFARAALGLFEAFAFLACEGVG